MIDREAIERSVIELIAADRLDIPISSLSGKLKRKKPELAKAIILPGDTRSFNGDRTYVRIEEKDTTEKARTMREAVDLFKQKHSKYGEILEKMISKTRKAKKTNLYFGINEGCRLAAEDYLATMQNLGFTEAGARNLYPELMEISRNLSRKREEERSIMLGTNL